MPWPPPQVSFEPLFQRLLERLRFQIAAGSLTVRRLAREIDVSQPHMQNVVSGKRALTVELADRLLEFLRISPFDLATGAELGGALERVAPTPEPIRYVPLLAGPLGPAHPFPELGGNAGWIPLPAHSSGELRQPVFAELGADAELATPGTLSAGVAAAGCGGCAMSPDAWLCSVRKGCGRPLGRTGSSCRVRPPTRISADWWCGWAEIRDGSIRWPSPAT